MPTPVYEEELATCPPYALGGACYVSTPVNEEECATCPNPVHEEEHAKCLPLCMRRSVRVYPCA